MAPVHARSIIAIAEAAAARGGLGAEDARRIADLPTPDRAVRPDARDARIGLFVSLAIPTLALVAAGIAAARWL